MVHKFWNQHPALLYGVAMLISFSLALSWSPYLLIPIAALCIPLAQTRRFKYTLAVMGISFAYASLHYTFPTPPEEGIPGTVHLEISSITSAQSHFSKQWIYRGTILTFVPDETHQSIAKNIPCYISIPQNNSIHRPPANRSYKIHGTLKQSLSGNYRLVVKKDTPWFPIKRVWNLSEIRLKVKSWVKQRIHRTIPSKQSATFLAGIATGEFDDPLMGFEFGRFGLQHIMAISGFHFAIIATILSMLLRPIASRKIAASLLIFILSSYFLFLGSSPSVMRAWLVITIALASCWIERRQNALNSLGVAMLLILTLNPLMCRSIGFQFSVMATAAILLFFSGIDFFLQRTIFCKRSLCEVVKMNRANQHGYLILATFRQGAALLIAVNIAVMPIMLFYFHKFPWLSLLYNLFFPFMVSVSMLLLLLGLIFPPFNTLNSIYTQFMLDFTQNLPTTFDFTWYIPDIPAVIVIIYTTLLLYVGIVVTHYMERWRESHQDFVFI